MEPEEYARLYNVARIAFPILFLLLTWFIGKTLEARHFRRLEMRERRARQFPIITLREAPEDWNVDEARMVTGSVVISVDYFKRFIAGLRSLIGGRIRSYESLMERARREALLRMIEAAFEQGYRAVINVRLETARLASSTRNGEGTAGIEVLAHGTALKLAKRR